MFTTVVVGMLLRVLRWIDDPAVWLDETFLALNLTDKSFAEIVGPLHNLQSAPPGFLAVEKSIEILLGDAERSLRLFPLLAALAAVGLFAYVARRILAPPAAVLAVVLFASGEPLLERAAEIKPYTVDVAAATTLAALTLWVIDGPRSRLLRRTALLAVVGIGLVWLSFPAAFSFATAVVVLCLHAWELRSWRSLIAAVVAGATTLVSFAGVYLVASSNVSRITEAIFAGGDSESGIGQLDIAQTIWSTLVNPGGFENGTHGLAALLACFGLVALAQRRSLHILALLAIPLGLAVVVEILGRYPLGGRFSLFLVPYLLLLVARGAQALVVWSRKPLLVSAGLALFLIAPSIALASYRAVDPPAREDVKPLLSQLVEEWREGDTLYVYGLSQYALRYYSTCDDCTSTDPLPWPTRIAPSSEPQNLFAPALLSVPPTVIIGTTAFGSRRRDVERFPKSGRLWMLFSHVQSHGRLDDEELLLAEVERVGRLVMASPARGARLYLFVLDPTRAEP